VLSFGRLSHRVFEEVGGDNLPVLDDTGKSLVLQRVALAEKAQLPVLGGHIHKQGYIHEVKSALSEFMQYGLSVEDVEKLSEFARGRDALQGKLKDLKTLYKSFQEYISGHFITTEEKVEKLRKSIGKSRIIKDSVIVFDGFTGFTPIQNRLIQELLVWAKEVIVTVTMGDKEDPFKQEGEQKLFYLSKKTVYDLEKMAQQVSVSRGEDIYARPAESPRFRSCNALTFLEKNLFRSAGKKTTDEAGSIRILEAHTPKEEIRQVGVEISRLVREKNLQYRDIAVISGDLESYAPFVEREFRDMHLPCYIDRTRGIILNPMIELIKSALDLFIKDFSYVKFSNVSP
jgi:ATP-dependent helicase/nuclease subunit B